MAQEVNIKTVTEPLKNTQVDTGQHSKSDYLLSETLLAQILSFLEQNMCTVLYSVLL